MFTFLNEKKSEPKRFAKGGFYRKEQSDVDYFPLWKPLKTVSVNAPNEKH